MSEVKDFSNYNLNDNVYELAGGLLPEIAETARFELGVTPNETNLSAFIGTLGPDKELQQNIGKVREVLGDNATGQMADWVERSGILFPVERAFADNQPLPDQTDAIVWSGGVANWMLRRSMLTQRLDPASVGRLVLPIGNRTMKPAEHQLVRTYQLREGEAPTEQEFVRTFVLGSLKLAGFKPELVPVNDGNGDRILDALFAEEPELLDGTVSIIANAPNAIQGAGQLRLAARRVDSNFDSDGAQLFMQSDSIPLARHGEKPATHQNPATALGQLARNALFIYKNQ